MTRHQTRRRSAVARGLLALAVAEAATTVVAAGLSGLPWDRLVDLFVVTNTVIGLSLALAGWPLARYRAANPVGWWLLAGGCLYAATATGIAVLARVVSRGGTAGPGWRVFATVTNGSWALALSLCLPMALLLFPDGRLPGRGWRWVVGLTASGSVLFTATAVLDPVGGMNAEVGAPGYPAWPGAARFGWVAALAGLLLVATYLALPVGLGVRYRRGDERVREQLLWPVLAVLAMLACFTVAGALDDDVFILLGVLPLTLVPASIAIALLRHRLLDIRLVVSRSLLYLLLTGAVLAAYLGLVGLLDRTTGSSILAALVIAVGFNPARVWLQRLVDRALYGARRDPVRAIAAIGARLGDTGLSGILAELCRVMRLPAAAILVDATPVAVHGELPDARHEVDLRQGTEVAGVLVVGLRPGEPRIAPADARIIALLAAPVAVAVQATRLADEVRASRERVITGREEERRRIRRDLHDGLGPMLTSVVLNADAAWHLLSANPGRSADLVAKVRDQTVTAIDDIRRLVYDLRPPALDGMGLVGALREYALGVPARADGGPLTVTVVAPEPVGELPAAVEVAAYRIATEAITNVARHSTAARAAVTLERADGRLHLSIVDDGHDGSAWTPGVGLASIRERAAELGGACRIEHDGGGARVVVDLPIAKGAG
jgi:signal transduction histidine kinase